MTDKHPIFGDTKLAASEGKRLVNLMDNSDYAAIEQLGKRVNKQAIEIAIQIQNIVDQIAALYKELQNYYVTAHQLRTQTYTAEENFKRVNEQSNNLTADINEKWDTYIYYYHRTSEEFTRVDMLPEVLEIHKQLLELHNQYEELILSLGEIIAPIDFNEF